MVYFYFKENQTDCLMKKITFKCCSLTAGWPNTYTFTKALAEDLAKHESIGLPFGIFRPSVGK